MRPFLPSRYPLADRTCACLERDGGKADGGGFAAPVTRALRARAPGQAHVPSRQQHRRKKNERGADAEPLYRRPPHIRFYNWHNLSSHIFVNLVKVLNDGTGDCAEIFPILKAFEIIAKQ